MNEIGERNERTLSSEQYLCQWRYLKDVSARYCGSKVAWAMIATEKEKSLSTMNRSHDLVRLVPRLVIPMNYRQVVVPLDLLLHVGCTAWSSTTRRFWERAPYTP